MDTATVTRRNFLRGRRSEPENSARRPPWSLDEYVFVARCDRCGDCLSACKESIIVKGDGGYPEVDFRRGECTFCGDCAAACEPGAIGPVDGREPWRITARIDPAACLSMNRVTCRSCGDSCETRALRFRVRVGGIAEPIIDSGLCTGCGACAAPCPRNAVTVVPRGYEEKRGVA